jgi:fructose-1-phosphate kinase PfkB-like protein
MGCGSSTLAEVQRPKSFQGATDSMLAGLTKGELQDREQEHNAQIKAALASARAEIALSKDR